MVKRTAAFPANRRKAPRTFTSTPGLPRSARIGIQFSF